MFASLKNNVDDYVKGKTWFWYLPVWLLGIHIFIQLLGFELGEQSPFIIAVPQAFNFMLHEMAHILFSFAPALVTASAGSFSELLLGALLIWGGFKGRTYFASLFGFLWFMLATQSTADYMADATMQQLPLVSLGDVSGSGAIHDWHFIFSELNLLGASTFIAGMTRFIGISAGFFGLAFAAWLVYKIAAAKTNDLNKKEVELLHQSVNATGLPFTRQENFKNHEEVGTYPGKSKTR